jgi:hypothetical protein
MSPATSLAMSTEHSAYPGHDPLLLSGGDAGKYRKRHDLVGCGFCRWELATPMAQIREGGKEVDRNGIMNSGPDSLAVQLVDHAIPVSPWHADDVQVPHVLIAFKCLWKLDSRDIGQELVVPEGGLTALPVPSFQPFQLRYENDRLKRIHPRVETEINVLVAPLAAMVPGSANPQGKGWIVRQHGTSITARAEVLTRIEADSCSMADCARWAASSSAAVTLRCILDYRNALAICYATQLLDWSHLPVQMHGHQGGCRGADLLRRLVDVDQVVNGVTVDEDWLCSGPHDGLRRSYVGVRGQYDLGPGPYAASPQG